MPGNPTQSRAGGLNPVEGFSNSILVCVNCEQEFVFTASAQKYFAERGFLEPPKRCKSCYKEYQEQEDPQEEESQNNGKPPRDESSAA